MMLKRSGGYVAGSIVRRGRISEARSSGSELKMGLARAWLEALGEALEMWQPHGPHRFVYHQHPGTLPISPSSSPLFTLGHTSTASRTRWIAKNRELY